MKKMFLLLLLATSTVLALSGCAAIEGQDLSASPISDEGITSIAKSRLNSDPMTGRATLSVTVENGLAILSGTVPDEAVRQRAIQILKGTDGIFDVLDHTRKR